jgi:stage V sporulation protein G
MLITEIRVFPKEGQDKKLKAYTTVTLDNELVIRNIKVIQGSNGLFIAMPSRKNKEVCPNCRHKNEVGSRFCNHCGSSLNYPDHTERGSDAKSDHKDIAHPITQRFRDYLQSEILGAYTKEVDS